jgi:serine/threonine protein phosphatase 1
MKYYVLSDIHGFYSIFRETLKKAGYEDDPGEKKLLLLGDLFDRGAEELELQRYILELMGEDRVILIKGNHEDLFQELVTTDHGRPLRHHVHNGTYDTLERLTGLKGYSWQANLRLAEAGRETPLYTEIIPAMLDYYETRSYIFTHAWIPCQSFYGGLVYDDGWREASPDQWREARWTNPMDAARTALPENKTVVCGHFHCSYGHSVYEGKGSEFGPDADFSPYYAPGIIAIDACTAYSKQMNCIVLED